MDNSPDKKATVSPKKEPKQPKEPREPKKPTKK